MTDAFVFVPRHPISDVTGGFMTTKLAIALISVLGFAPLAQAEDAAALPALSALEVWQADPTTVIEAEGVTLEEFRWIARPVVVFADTPADPRFRQQMELLAARPEDLAERDVVVIVDTDPAAKTAIRTHLRPRGFMLAILAKDGTVMLRKPFPWDIREITRSIDKLPLRKQEVRDSQGTGG
jgi:hypothetical protein